MNKIPAKGNFLNKEFAVSDLMNKTLAFCGSIKNGVSYLENTESNRITTDER
jgi:hypothetical protein